MNKSQLIEALAKEKNLALKSDTDVQSDPAMFVQALGAVRRHVGHDALIVVISDFDGLDERARKILLELTRHNDVICALVHDPSATRLPASSDFVITDGELQVELKLADRRVRRRVHQAAKGRITHVLETLHQIGIPVLPLNTLEDVTEQVRRFLGYAPGTSRGGIRRV